VGNSTRHLQRRLIAAAVGLLATGVLALFGLSAPSVGSAVDAAPVAHSTADDIAELLAPLRQASGTVFAGPPAAQSPDAAATQPTVRLAAVGDFGMANDGAYAVARAMTTAAATQKFDALILLGDNVYPVGDPSLVQKAIFDPLRDLLNSGTRLLPVLGNHDVVAGHGDELAAALGMPGRWYAHEVGSVLFIGLDSTQVEEPAQRAWLEQTLAGSTNTWKIVALHHPPFSAGMHGSEQDAQQAFSPLFEQYGVHLVLSGHDHDYQRNDPIRGVTYMVSGGGSKVRPTGTAEFTAVSASTLHFLDIGVWSDRLHIRAVDQTGQPFDEVTLTP
jgi:3',5'-cyclic AMP phosphodiesterase CpdA